MALKEAQKQQAKDDKETEGKGAQLKRKNDQDEVRATKKLKTDAVALEKKAELMRKVVGDVLVHDAVVQQKAPQCALWRAQTHQQDIASVLTECNGIALGHGGHLQPMKAFLKYTIIVKKDSAVLKTIADSVSKL